MYPSIMSQVIIIIILYNNVVLIHKVVCDYVEEEYSVRNRFMVFVLDGVIVLAVLWLS